MFIRRDMSIARSLALDLGAGALTALAGMCVIAFLSPPLPLYDRTCGTGWNEPLYLVIASALLFGRWGLVTRVIRSPSPKLGNGFEVVPVRTAERSAGLPGFSALDRGRVVHSHQLKSVGTVPAIGAE